jgi:uncharacterized membrane protein YkvA (DUF1232 family)
LVAIVKSPVKMARRIASDLREARQDSGIQLARATILAYFVMPNDLVPDDAPGGFGYLDDVILLRVGASEALDKMFPDEDPARVMWLLANALPEHVIPTIGEVMTKLQESIQSIAAMNPSSPEER